MKKCVGLLLILSFAGSHLMAQSISPTFTLHGTINADSGTMILLPVGESYFPYPMTEHEAIVIKGNFQFRGFISYPCAFRLGLKVDSAWKYLSDIFMIEPCEQSVRCSVDSLWEIPAIDNASMAELKAWQAALPDKSSGPAREAYQLAYVKAHPDSYVALWELIERFGSGYEARFDSLNNAFSEKIKNTFAGAVLAKRLASGRVTGVGRPFPAFELLDMNNHKVTVPGTEKRSCYTLVDFWFAHCSACIGQFPQFKKMYAAYKGGGLEIISISTDREKERNDWLTAIRQQGLDWKQYLDLGGKLAIQLSINAFPTNFLLDGNGIIIRKDISPEELEKLLLTSSAHTN